MYNLRGFYCKQMGVAAFFNQDIHLLMRFLKAKQQLIKKRNGLLSVFLYSVFGKLS